VKRQRIRRILISACAVLFPVVFFYFSPYLIIMAAGERVVAGAFIVFGSLFVVSLIAGRAFCGWLCPMGGIAEATSKARDKRIRRRWIDWIKMAYWPIWLGLIALTAVRAGGFSRVDFLYQTWHGISVSNVGSAVLAVVIIGLVVVLTLAVGRRAFCHSLCWISPFMILGTWIRDRLRLASLKLTATPITCVSCGACTRNCPMSLDVREGMVARGDMRNRECILCGTCADGCPTETIAFRFGPARDHEPHK
jgi:ferredoxin-type protein NapH